MAILCYTGQDIAGTHVNEDMRKYCKLKDIMPTKVSFEGLWQL